MTPRSGAEGRTAAAADPALLFPGIGPTIAPEGRIFSETAIGVQIGFELRRPQVQVCCLGMWRGGLMLFA
jgi:hypothetical protein